MAKKKPRARIQKPQTNVAKVRAMKAKYPNASAKRIASMAKVPINTVYQVTCTDRKNSQIKTKVAKPVSVTDQTDDIVALVGIVNRIGSDRVRKVLEALEK